MGAMPEFHADLEILLEAIHRGEVRGMVVRRRTRIRRELSMLFAPNPCDRRSRWAFRNIVE